MSTRLSRGLVLTKNRTIIYQYKKDHPKLKQTCLLKKKLSNQTNSVVITTYHKCQHESDIDQNGSEMGVALVHIGCCLFDNILR